MSAVIEGEAAEVAGVYGDLLRVLAALKGETDALPRLLALAGVQDDLQRLQRVAERRARRNAGGDA